MSAFEMSLNVFGTSIAVPDEEARKRGVSNVEITLAVAQQLPFSQPGSPPVMAHLGNVKYSLDRDSAIEFFKSGLEAAAQLPPTSKLEIATDLHSAEQTAEQLAAMRGPNAA